MKVWEEGFATMDVKKYTLVKRGSITKELEQIKELVKEEPVVLAGR